MVIILVKLAISLISSPFFSQRRSPVAASWTDQAEAVKIGVAGTSMLQSLKLLIWWLNELALLALFALVGDFLGYIVKRQVCLKKMYTEKEIILCVWVPPFENYLKSNLYYL